MRQIVLSVAVLALSAGTSAADEPPKKGAPTGKVVYTVKTAPFPMKGVVVTVHNLPGGDHEVRIENTEKSEAILSVVAGSTRSVTVIHVKGRVESVTVDKKRIPFSKTAPEPKELKPFTPKPKPKADNEAKAASYLAYAKKLLEKGMKEKARERIEEVAKDFPETKAGVEAKGLLEKLKE